MVIAMCAKNEHRTAKYGERGFSEGCCGKKRSNRRRKPFHDKKCGDGLPEGDHRSEITMLW